MELFWRALQGDLLNREASDRSQSGTWMDVSVPAHTARRRKFWAKAAKVTLFLEP